MSSIGVGELRRVFDDDWIRRLASLENLLKRFPNADRAEFEKVLRAGLRQYVQSVNVPSVNEVHRQIKALERAADREKYDKVADLLESSAPTAQAARDCLRERLSLPVSAWRGVVLPDAATLRDPTRQKKACELVGQLCRCGGLRKEGRSRPNGKQSRSTIEPELYGPMPSTRISKREAELDLVTSLQRAFYRATGRYPPWTANYNALPNPFVQMVQEVLDLVRAAGAQRADAVGLINKLTKRRNKKYPDWRKKLLMASVSTNKS
jgi:hypothetical protein